MNTLELKESLINLRARISEIISTGEAEKRELTTDENTELVELKAKVDEIENDIKTNEEENRKLQKDNNTNTKKENRNMSLITMINNVLENRTFNEVDAKAMAEARADFAKSGISPKGQIVLRSINATTAGEGMENVAEDKWNLEVAVRNNLVATKMGADFVGGLVGDVSIPKYSGSSVKWKGETATAEDGKGEFSEITLQPKRLTATIDVSKQWLLQSSSDAEAILIRDLAAAVAEKLDSTIFGDGAGDTNTPAGLFNGVTADTALSAISYDDVLEMELAVEENNGHNYMFIVNPKVKFALKATQMANGLQMVFDGNEIDGYKTISSNSVVSKGAICLEPKELVIGQWGGYDITIDPYTKAADGQVRLVINAYFDAKLRGDKVSTKLFN